MNSVINYGCGKMTAVISGGTSGIGLAAAAKLLNDGATVYLLGRSLERGQAAVTALQKNSGAAVTYICCDVRSSASCEEAAARIAAASGSIDILINCAGVYEEQRLENITEAVYDELMDTNVRGTVLLTKAVKRYMERGCIVNVASDAAVSGNYGCPVYCAAKGAVVAWTKALALDLAPHIRVNCVCPADVDTPLVRRQLTAADGGYTLSDMAAVYPLGRIGEAEEIAHMICSAVSPANSFMTGSIITVDGGLTA